MAVWSHITNVKFLLMPPSRIGLLESSWHFYLHQPSIIASKMLHVSYTENEVTEAILDVTNNGLPQSQVAEKHGVPLTNRSDRLRGLLIVLSDR